MSQRHCIIDGIKMCRYCQPARSETASTRCKDARHHTRRCEARQTGDTRTVCVLIACVCVLDACVCVRVGCGCVSRDARHARVRGDTRARETTNTRDSHLRVLVLRRNTRTCQATHTHYAYCAKMQSQRTTTVPMSTHDMPLCLSCILQTCSWFTYTHCEYMSKMRYI